MSLDKIAGDLFNIKELNTPSAAGSAKKLQQPFDISDSIKEKVDEVNSQLVSASQKSEEFLTTGKHDLHEVIIELEKADLSFRYMTQVRDRVLSAYNEMMRMQV